MKKSLFILILVFSQLTFLGQGSLVSLKFIIEREMVSLDSTLMAFFVLNGDTIYPAINGNTFNVPKSVINNYADFYFIYKKYKLVYYSVLFNYSAYENRIWVVNIDKRPIDKTDYYLVPKKDWWKIKWVYTLVRGNSQITQYVYWFPFSTLTHHE